jgi:hypothetical protein
MTREERLKIHNEEEQKWLATFIEANLENFKNVEHTDDVLLSDDEIDLLVKRLFDAYNDNDDIIMIVEDLADEVIRDFLNND